MKNDAYQCTVRTTSGREVGNKMLGYSESTKVLVRVSVAQSWCLVAPYHKQYHCVRQEPGFTLPTYLGGVKESPDTGSGLV